MLVHNVLVVDGIKLQPVVFTAVGTGTSRDQWRGIVFSTQAKGFRGVGVEGSSLKHVVIRYTGAGNSPAVKVEKEQPVFDGLIIEMGQFGIVYVATATEIQVLMPCSHPPRFYADLCLFHPCFLLSTGSCPFPHFISVSFPLYHMAVRPSSPSSRVV